MKQLELKHLVSYLPYGLECEILNYKSDYVGEKYGIVKGFYTLGDIPHYTFKHSREYAGKTGNQIKPILHPISDLIKEIEVNGRRFIPIKEFYEMYGGGYLSFENWYDQNWISYNVPLQGIPYEDMQKLFEWHFDVFGLIKKGLAIDINQVKE